MDETITIPTELTRADEFVVGVSALGSVLIAWWVIQRGVPWPLVVFPVGVAVVWMLTTRAAAEIRGVGFVASWLRNRLGERSLYGWLKAYWHFVQVVEIPRGQAFCARLLKSARHRVSNFRRQPSDTTA